MDTELERFLHLMSTINIGKINLVTGNNGTGKSRFFAVAAAQAISKTGVLDSRFRQLLCLSGTHNDKYPRQIWNAGPDDWGICYLGYKVANNMISDIAPFRVIVGALLGEGSIRRSNPEAVSFCLEKLNIDPEIKLHFRYGKNRKDGLSDFVSNEVIVNLESAQEDMTMLAIKGALREKGLSLQTISVKRNSRYYTLSDLSSGERSYMLTLLGALYCAKNRALIFFDEPENSLHPGWQKTILRDFRKVLELNGISTTILVATHSPLIAGSVPNNDAFTCNFPTGQRWHESDLYGKTADSTLKDQFSIYSSRSTTVVKITQICLSFIAKGDLDHPELYRAIDTLLEFGLTPETGDPMREILQTLSYLREHHELP
ncbi:AAA family ATPase [Pseudomonas sp. MPC6]|uniref:AAA family ATPase n=1 Tax=unclassified Pseudomonas TaxID=196821 RepID=UPI00110FFDA4|nr:AAA family ATPase [Pseudomonas sp. MPC6]QCY14130.1 ATP-binding protein [Pseudomonas sp. MPC6]